MAVHDNFLRELSSSKFNAEQYVQELCVTSKGASDLLAKKQKVLAAADETNGLLKKNVYKNYTQFIETAREISYLENEMYQLSHMLSEQKSLMASLMETSLTGDRVQSLKEKDVVHKEEETKKNLTSLLEKVEGCMNVMEVPGRYLVYSSDLTELDPIHLTQVQRIHAFLLNDSVMIATWLPNRRGPVHYKFQVLYELESISVVSVTDMGNVKNAFKLLIFPDTRLFSCDNAKGKKDWLDFLDNTKQAKANTKSMRRESIYDKTWTPATGAGDGNAESPEELPQWLVELPEDLDVCIAQRDFEEAAKLIDKSSKFFSSNPKNLQGLKEMKVRIDQRMKNLTTVLTNELKVTADKSLQGGSRAARRAVVVLIHLGKSVQACDLFLRYRSALLKSSTKQVKIEGVTTKYVQRLCSAFFSQMTETCKEFVHAFPDHPDCYSILIVWATTELHSFSSNLSRQVFTPQTTFSTVAASIALARSHCQAMSETGLDMTFLLDSYLYPEVKKTILETKDKLLEAIKLRTQEDKWRPTNWQNKAGLNKFLEDFVDLGFPNITQYVFEECWVSLTSNIINFTKAYVNFVDVVLKFHTSQTGDLIVETLVELFKAQLRHVISSFSNDAFQSQIDTIKRNAAFLVEVLDLLDKQFKEKINEKCPSQLSNLRFELNRLTGRIGVYI